MSSDSARPRERTRLFGSYGDILSVPGSWRFTLAGW
ncbi:MAG: hypothetical protein JWR01_410, partial [Subtercola sp.]|nr:hypothetical protein [Subtercola sp.]